MDIHFYKYHGTGNDFILIDDREAQFPASKELIASMCDRHFGIGGDGLILLGNSSGFDFGMTYFNSDGNESSMCGNGGRCMIAFADFLSLIAEKAYFLAADGAHQGVITGKEGNSCQVRLQMRDVVEVRHAGGDYFIDTGSPHFVRFAVGIDDHDILGTGRQIRYSEEFSPGGANVDLVELEKDGLYVRTYERGVEDETLSCGTGVTAAALAYAEHHGMQSGSVKVRTRGGRLHVSWKKTGHGFGDIWLEGPATRVFSGTFKT